MDRAWGYVAVTLVATVAGQLTLKHAMEKRGAVPSGGAEVVAFVGRSLLDPLVVVSLLLAVLAALSWIAVISRLELSVAYPFMSLAFVLTTLLGGLLLGESVSATRWAGIACVVLGLALVARG